MAEVSSPLTTVARKRRREVIQTKRAVTAQTADASVTAPPSPPLPPPTEQVGDEVLPPKKRKIPLGNEVMSAPIPTPSLSATPVPDPTAGLQTDVTPLETTQPTPSIAFSSAAAAASEPPSDNDDMSQSKKKSRTQIQYNPGVPMSKEQLAAWRREMRRMRNRESAAASRQKIRDRIELLEGEVNEWKAKYDDAMRRLSQTEQALHQR
mmetsp:Transcript_9532/g.14028  ORF Transcript_9532/g.14028 Transcript_9532/m.14028 type:complete len:208 (+) Transcript_9532:148-771(+)